MHCFWIGAVPAMLFLAIVMMPFYYGSKVRSVPEFMRRRFGTGAHLVNALSFAVAQILIAGINLFLLATIVNALLGWPLWISLIVAAAVVLSYITLGASVPRSSSSPGSPSEPSGAPPRTVIGRPQEPASRAESVSWTCR